MNIDINQIFQQSIGAGFAIILLYFLLKEIKSSLKTIIDQNSLLVNQMNEYNKCLSDAVKVMEKCKVRAK